MGYRTTQKFHNESWMPESTEEVCNVLSLQGIKPKWPWGFCPAVYFLVKNAKFKNSCLNTWSEFEERGTFFHFWWDCKVLWQLWKSIWSSSEIFRLIYLRDKDQPYWCMACYFQFSLDGLLLRFSYLLSYDFALGKHLVSDSQSVLCS